KISKEFPNKLEVINKQIINLPNILVKEVEINDEISRWFTGIETIKTSDWRSDPIIKFVGVFSPINSRLFLRFVIKQLVRKDLFFWCGRTQFVVFVSEKEYNCMTATPPNFKLYRSINVMYNTLFDIESLETVPYNEFAFYSSQPTTKSVSHTFDGNARLVRLTPKEYLDELDEQTLKDYYYFVTQTFMKRKSWIIPFLENWFPNCGPDLIRKGIPVFKYFGDLRPEEMLDLFKYCYNRSDYNSSIYKAFSQNDIFDNEIDVQDIKLDEEDIDTKDKEQLVDNEL
ncbi:unnamed protein product, partial [Medioppia subpectinata]